MRQLIRIRGPVQVPAGPRETLDLAIGGDQIRSSVPHPELSENDVTLTWTEDGVVTERTLPRTVCLPAFVDGHTHLVGLGLSRLRPDLSPAGSPDEALALLESWLETHPGETPVIAEGWDQSHWSPPRSLLGRDLDRLGESRPIAARRVCGHVAAFNTPALAALGTGWTDLDVELGTAKEELPLALTRLWPPTESEFDEAVLWGQKEAVRLGVGWVHEMGDRSTWSAFRRAESRGDLEVRVSHFFRCEGRGALSDLERLVADGLGVPGPGRFESGDRLRFAGIKLFLDGSIGARSAAVREAYPEDGGHGLLVWSDESLVRALEICRDQDWPVAAHAIGDRAVEQFLGALETTGFADRVGGGVGPRIEHAEMLPRDLNERARQLGALLSMQPNFTDNWQGPGGLYEQVLGMKRARDLNPYRNAAEGGRLLFGSDTMPLGPLVGVRGAETHPDPGQRLSLEGALHAYTAGAAQGVRFPFHGASIAPGEPAHLIFLQTEENPGSGGVPERSVLGTVIDGAVRGALADAEEATR